MRYFLFRRPFKGLTTKGVHLMLIGNSISFLSGLGRQFILGWPVGLFAWVMWLFPLLALLMAGLVWQALVREYIRRPDKPKRIWHFTLTLENK
jgi:hypothetical protein